MSIYASIEGIGDLGDPEHLGQPWVYRGSHLTPAGTDPRAGSIGLAVIPSHITADGRDDQPEDGAPWPWLRLSLDVPGDDPAVLIDPAQARYLAEQLTAWADRAEPAAAAETPELTAEEARDLADELGTDLYRAQDALAFVGECCDIADREQQPVTTRQVREWLKGAQCGRQLAADSPDLYGKISGMFGVPLPPPGDEPPSTVLPCSHAHLRQPHTPHPWQPQLGMRAVQCPGYARIPSAAEVTEHVYLSTGCLHGRHDYCLNVDGIAGLKKPAQCKFCAAPCTCPCHKEKP